MSPTLSSYLIQVITEGIPASQVRAALVLCWRGALTIGILDAYGFIGPGFVTSAEAESIAAVKLQPVIDELKRVVAELEKNNNQARKERIEGVILRIRELQKACMGTQPETAARSRIAALIEISQLEYQQLTERQVAPNIYVPGQRYPLNPQCD